MFILRRWPYITSALIATNLLVFLFTYQQLQHERDRYVAIESQTVKAAAIYPQIPLTPAQRVLVDAFRRSHPQDWDRMASLPSASPDLDEITRKVGELAPELDDFQNDALAARFSLYPPRSAWFSALTANFLHRGWTHLVFNIFFLWLVGGTLEDVWGRRMYAAMLSFCALAGAWIYTVAYGAGLIPLIGASGIIAGLMGFYLIRFPKTTIQHGTAIWAVRQRLLHLSSPALIVFPLWLLGLAFWGKTSGETSNAAYLAQGGAFALGAVLGFVLRTTGIQNHMTRRIEAEAAFSVDRHIAKASEFLQRGNLDAAITAVNAQIAEKPHSVEAHEMLVSLYLRKGNVALKYLKALEGLCDVQLKASNPEAAWEYYETYLKAGGRKMPADIWLKLARFAENQGQWERALTEYEELARSWPDDRASVLALMSAGRIQLQQFGRREEAKNLYIAARDSRVPHGAWDDIIRKGIEKAGGTPVSEADLARPARRPTQSS